MPHATEGDLHAHLDGALAVIDESAAERLTAHLARCADCRARLEQERVIRDRAGALLGVALPVVDAPPFETVVGSAGRRPQRMTTERLAWAAAIIVALGAGWIGNAVLRGVPDSLMISVAPAELDRAELASSSPESDSRESQVATESADRPIDELPARKSVAGEAVAEPTAGPETLAEVDALPVAGAAVLEAPADVLSEDARQFADDDVALRERSGSLVGEQLKDAIGSVAWREVDEAEARRWIGRAPLRIEELDVAGFDVGELAGAKVLRVRQQLPGGETVTLVQEVVPGTGGRDFDLEDRRNEEPSRLGLEQERAAIAGPPPAAADANRAAERELAKRTYPVLSTRDFVNGVWVTLRAPLAPDSLRALVSRIR